MSGPKCFEVTETALQEARRSNRALCDTFLAEYRRLFQQNSEMLGRARNLALSESSFSTDPSLLADRVERAFANVREGGIDVVRKLLREKQAAEERLVKLTAAVRDQVADLQRRVRELRKRVGSLHEARAQFERGLETALPAHWPGADVTRIRASAVAQLTQIEIPTLVESAETPEEIARLSATEDAVSAAQRALSVAEQKFQQDMRDTHARLVTSKLESGQTSAETLKGYLAKRSSLTTGKTSTDEYAEKADQLLADLCLLQNHASWRSLRNRASAIEREEDPASRRTCYEALLLDCSTLLRQLRDHGAWQKRIEALLDRTSAATGLSVGRLRGQLQDHLRAGTMVDISDLERELALAVAEEEQRRMSEARRQAVLDSLAAIGYEIDGSPMETGLVRAGNLVIRKPGNEEYSVEVVMNPDMTLVQTAMVRHADTEDMTEQQRLLDCEQEESWCGDHARIREEMARRGFDSAFKLKLPSGQHPVRVVVRSEAERARRHTKLAPMAKSGKRQPLG